MGKSLCCCFLNKTKTFKFTSLTLKVGDNSFIIHKSAYHSLSLLISKRGFSSLQTRKTFGKIQRGNCRFLRAVFHWVEFSTRNDILSCLLTSTLPQLVFKQKKMLLRGKFLLVENGLNSCHKSDATQLCIPIILSFRLLRNISIMITNNRLVLLLPIGSNYV